MNNIESLLDKLDIEQVIQNATNPIYRVENIISLGRKKTDIIRVSPKQGLILIYGNSKTGLVHINERHNFYQNIPVWKKKSIDNKQKYLLDNPSRFSGETIPFFDYIKIAEVVYKPENLNIDENRNREFSDMYDGEVVLRNNENCRYRLILYKNTKLIHNLFPIENKFTPQQLINYQRGSLCATQDLQKCISLVRIPYLNHEKIVIYEIILLFDEVSKKERHYIQVNTFTGQPFITHLIGEKKMAIKSVDSTFLMRFESADLSFFENEIVKIESFRK